MAADETKQTRERILDAAEALFSVRGFYGVTVRQITREAGVDVALANYYFGKKQDLFAAVFERRAATLNAERLAALDACVAQAPDGIPTVEAIISAFVEPLCQKAAEGGQGWKNYLALVAQVNNSREWGASFMGKSFDPVVRRFIDVLKRALPDADEADLYWSYHFFSGALVLTFAETGRIDKLSNGVCRSADLAAVYGRMPAFIAGGFRTLCGNGSRAADPEHGADGSTTQDQRLESRGS
jgi:AcrR family transcriptional regulator